MLSAPPREAASKSLGNSGLFTTRHRVNKDFRTKTNWILFLSLKSLISSMKEDCFESWKRGFFERGNLAHVVTRLTANLVCLGLLLSVLEVLWKGVLNCKILGSSYQSTFLANTKTKLQPLIFLIIDDLLILYLMHARILLLLSLKITYNLKTCFGICVKASEETLLTPR